MFGIALVLLPRTSFVPEFGMFFRAIIYKRPFPETDRLLAISLKFRKIVGDVLRFVGGYLEL